jgi:hypothetical protein
MAQGTDHIVAGIVVWVVSLPLLQRYVVSSPKLVILLLCAISGALFPDIDIKSKGQRLFFSIMVPLYIFSFVYGRYVLCGCITFIAVLPSLVSHRGIFHRLWFIVAIACIFGVALISILPTHKDFIKIGTIVFMCGALSHLVLDFGVCGMLHRK